MNSPLGILIKALRYYSDPKIFIWETGGKALVPPEIMYDRGKKAQEALEQFEKKTRRKKNASSK